MPHSAAELGKAIGLSAASRAAATFASLGINAIFARSLTHSEFAYFGVLISFSAAFAVFLQFGYQTNITKLAGEASHASDHSALAAGIWGGTAIIFLLSVAAYPPLLEFHDRLFPKIDDTPASAELVALTLGYCTALSLAILYSEAIRGLGMVGMASSLTGMGQHGGIVRSALLLLATIPLALIHILALETALIAGIAASFVAAGWSLALLARCGALRSTPGETLREFRGNMSRNIQMMSGQLLQMGASQHATLIIAGAILSGFPLALLVAAQQLRNLLTAPMTLFNGASPKLLIHAFRSGNLKELEQLSRLGTSSAVAIIVVSAPILLLAGKPIFSLVFGSEYADASFLFALLYPGLLAFAMGGGAGRLLILLGYQRTFLVYSAVMAAFSIPMLAWSATEHGAVGISITTSILLIAQNVILVILARKRLGVWSHAYLSPRHYLQFSKSFSRIIRQKLPR